MANKLKDAALHYHRHPKPGKIRVQATKPLSNQHDLALAYSPGVAEPCREIAKDPLTAADYTSRSNLVGVISNGSAVLGLGNIGALAAKPVMEGKAILFKNFADVDAFDIEVDEADVDKFVEAVARLEPTFGGINLEDIKAPECFEIEAKLRERLNIPVFHDDQHGTAIVSAAAVHNGLKVVGKKIEDISLVVSGAGAAAMACTNLLIKIGVNPNKILMLDSRGVIHSERDNLSTVKQRYAVKTDARTLADALINSDVFLGVSQANLMDVEMLMSMADNPLILAMANPDPEIHPDIVKKHRPDAVIATGRSDFPNQVNNVLCFPFLFRGALDVGATSITPEMEIACVYALAELALSESNEKVAAYYQNESLKFGKDYILPKPFDPRLITAISPQVAQAAVDSGVSTLPFDGIDEYRRSLEPLVYRSGNVMRPLFEKAGSISHKVVYTDGENERVLRAVQDVVDSGYARPMLMGDKTKISQTISELGLRLQEKKDFEVISSQFDKTVDRIAEAVKLVDDGLAHGVISGPGARLHEQTSAIDACALAPSSLNQLAVLNLLLLDQGSFFIADSCLHIDPTAEELAQITLMACEEIPRFGMTPRVALLSHSNFGSHETPSSIKMAKTKEILQELAPELEVDGEMRASQALNAAKRSKLGMSKLTGDANLLIMPNLDSADITVTALTGLANGIAVGPIILGTRIPIHTLTHNSSPRGIVNLTCLVASTVKA